MKGEGGFTLIEVVVAMTILGFAVLGLQAVVTDRLLQDVGREEARATARQLVDDRLSLVQSEPEYAQIPGRYTGTETALTGFTGFTRRTTVAQRLDHTVVTVDVYTPIYSDTVSGTVVVGVP